MNKRQQIRNQLHFLLVAISPEVFDMDNPKPLAIGACNEIKELYPELTKQQLQRFLRWWTARFKYLYAVKNGYHRYHVSGRQSGTITDDERKQAEKLIGIRKQKLNKVRSKEIPFTEKTK